HAALRAEEDGVERAERNQEHARAGADPEPDQRQRKPANTRDRARQLNGRFDERADPAVVSEQDAERNAEDRSAGKAAGHALETLQEMREKFSGEGLLRASEEEIQQGRQH